MYQSHLKGLYLIKYLFWSNFIRLSMRSFKLGAFLADFPIAFDCLSNELVIAKLAANGFKKICSKSNV